LETASSPSLLKKNSSRDDQPSSINRRAYSVSPIELILSRRSVRRFKQKAIPQEVLNKILEAGRQAPSAANRQPWHLIIITDDNLKKQLSKGLFNRFIRNAPLTIVGCANTRALLTGKWAVIDTSIALENVVLAAWTLGIGSCWIGDFKEKKVKQLLNIPSDWTIVALLALGYPAEKPKQRRKKSLESLTSFNNFNSSSQNSGD
jgi:nitroreductase